MSAAGSPRCRRGPAGGFTLVELMIGASLSLIVMTAVLSSYLFLGRNLTRMANQQSVETEGRRLQAMFAQDTRAALGISNPTSSSLTLNLPVLSSTVTSRTVAYAYHASGTTLNGVSVPAYSVTRTYDDASVSPETRVLLRDVVPLSFAFKYFDESGYEYTDPTSAAYRQGLKQVAFSYVARTGSGVNGTLTPNYTAESPRFVLRNKGLLQ
jgi:Tfp pilus assembly protein PilW